MQFHQEAEQILQATPESVNRPRRDHVELAPGNSTKQRIELLPLQPPLCSAYAVVNELGNAQTTENQLLQLRAVAERHGWVIV